MGFGGGEVTTLNPVNRYVSVSDRTGHDQDGKT